MRASGTPGLGGGPRSSSRWTWPSRAVGGQGGTEGLPPEPASATSASQAVFRSPRESAATAARREPLGPAAPPLSPRVLDPGLPLLPAKKKKKESLFPKRCVLPSAGFPGTLAGSAGWRLLLLPGGPQGKAAFPERPAHLPGRRRYLQGCNLRCNFPASLRPAPRDAARARAPARRSAAPEPRGAARPRRSPPQPGLPARAPGRKAGGLVTCPRRSRNRSDQCLSASAWPRAYCSQTCVCTNGDEENACCGPLDFWGAGGGGGRGGKNWPFQELVPSLILSLSAGQLFGHMPCTPDPRRDPGSPAAWRSVLATHHPQCFAARDAKPVPSGWREAALLLHVPGRQAKEEGVGTS